MYKPMVCISMHRSHLLAPSSISTLLLDFLSTSVIFQAVFYGLRYNILPWVSRARSTATFWVVSKIVLDTSKTASNVWIHSNTSVVHHFHSLNYPHAPLLWFWPRSQIDNSDSSNQFRDFQIIAFPQTPSRRPFRTNLQANFLTLPQKLPLFGPIKFYSSLIDY